MSDYELAQEEQDGARRGKVPFEKAAAVKTACRETASMLLNTGDFPPGPYSSRFRQGNRNLPPR